MVRFIYFDVISLSITFYIITLFRKSIILIFYQFLKFILVLGRDAANNINTSDSSNDSEPAASKRSKKRQVHRKVGAKGTIKARQLQDTSSSDEEKLRREVIAATGKN